MFEELGREKIADGRFFWGQGTNIKIVALKLKRSTSNGERWSHTKVSQTNGLFVRERHKKESAPLNVSNKNMIASDYMNDKMIRQDTKIVATCSEERNETNALNTKRGNEKITEGRARVRLGLYSAALRVHAIRYRTARSTRASVDQSHYLGVDNPEKRRHLNGIIKKVSACGKRSCETKTHRNWCVVSIRRTAQPGTSHRSNTLHSLLDPANRLSAPRRLGHVLPGSCRRREKCNGICHAGK